MAERSCSRGREGVGQGTRLKFWEGQCLCRRRHTHRPGAAAESLCTSPTPSVEWDEPSMPAVLRGLIGTATARRMALGRHIMKVSFLGTCKGTPALLATCQTLGRLLLLGSPDGFLAAVSRSGSYIAEGQVLHFLSWRPLSSQGQPHHYPTTEFPSLLHHQSNQGAAEPGQLLTPGGV